MKSEKSSYMNLHSCFNESGCFCSNIAECRRILLSLKLKEEECTYFSILVVSGISLHI